MGFTELTYEFVKEATGLVDALERALLELEGTAQPGPALSSIKRFLHTLKGNAGMLGAHTLQQALHQWEEHAVLLERSTETSPLHFKAVDALRAELAALEAGAEPGQIGELLVSRLNGEGPEAENGPKLAADLAVAATDLDALLASSSDLMMNNLALQRLLLKGSSAHALRAAVDALDLSARVAHQRILELRAVPLSQLLRRFARLVRDDASAQNKSAQFVMKGADAKVDRALFEPLSQAVLHLVKNAVVHGLETPEERLALGKPATGTVSVRATPLGGQVEISVEDDGRGLNDSAIRKSAAQLGLPSQQHIESLIFAPGLSTASLSSNAGRGVGLDAVRSALIPLGGSIQVRSQPGIGTRFILKVPSSLALQRALLCRVGEDTFAIPTSHVVEAFRLHSAHVRWLGNGRALEFGGQLVPLIDPETTLGAQLNKPGFAVVMEAGSKAALPVEELLGQQDLVFHPLEPSVCGTSPASAAGLFDNGRVVLRLDPHRLVSSARQVQA